MGDSKTSCSDVWEATQLIANRSDVLRRIRTAGLDRVQQAVEGLVMDSIRVSTRPFEGGLVAVSKLGGNPDLPAGESWPERSGKPLAFIGQFRMRDMAPYDSEKVLPDDGMMWFFYDAEDQPWGDFADRGGWKTIYRNVSGSAVKPTEPPSNLPEACRFAPCLAQFSTEATLPGSESFRVQVLNLDDDEAEAYTELLGWLGGGDVGRHRLLGHPDTIQGEMEDQCERESRSPYYLYFKEDQKTARLAELAERSRAWRLLCQIDSDGNTGMEWGDTGRLYYWVRGDALRERNLDDVWLVLQCS